MNRLAACPIRRRNHRRKYFLVLFASVLLLALFHAQNAHPSESAKDLIQTDSHDILRCVICHLFNSETESLADSPIDYDQEDTCRGCHDTIRMHSVGMPFKGAIAGSEEVRLPLLLVGDVRTVTCLTCHVFHGIGKNENLLRAANPFKSTRLVGLCFTCHTESDMKAKSPHTSNSRTCGNCHKKTPVEGQTFTVEEYLDFQRMCAFCHGRMPESHFADINPLSDPELAVDPERIGLLFLQGEYACFSCHDPHAQASSDQKLLKFEYIALATYSRRINPHWKNVMCITCHSKKPEKGQPNLRMGGNVNLMCSRCHNDETTADFLHPVNCEPSEKVKIPDSMPLDWGRVTCQTCHDSSLQETGADIHIVYHANPCFLRAPGLSPSEFCFQCHIPESFSRINVHDQIDENGFLKKAMCAGCHYVLPKDKGELDMTTDWWEIDPKEFCILCHRKEVYVDNHPTGPHVGEPSKKVYSNILLAEKRIGTPLPLFKGRITCSTCHDPHQLGVLKVHSRLEDTLEGKGLRALYRELLCTGCHARE